MKNRRKFKKLAAKYAEYSVRGERSDSDRVLKIMGDLKSMPRSQAIYLISKFLKGVRKRKGATTLIIESAIDLSKTQIEKIVQKLKKEFIITDVKTIVDPSLLGGFRVTIGDTVLDYTFKGKLYQMREALT